jgi:hypothetical protein
LQAWIDGFLSGLAEEIDFIAPKATEVAYYAWIDNYCRQNPLDLVVRSIEERIDDSRAPLAVHFRIAIAPSCSGFTFDQIGGIIAGWSYSCEK